MSHIAKPRVHHPSLQKNRVGLTRRDYEGSMSTLCAGCGHDSVTAALIQAFFEMDLEPHRIAKLSGIGCSAKTPTYFVREAHGFNSVHGRMPAVTTGAIAANRELVYVGISGDGDSLSIGLGQFCHAVRRNINMLYVLENNGVYGLTKGQFSASADVGSTSKRGVPNLQKPIDPVPLALALGASFVARSFSGDKDQLVPILKAGMAHNGFAFLDVISPCVTFNDHVGSTKSYSYTRDHHHELAPIDFVPVRDEITARQKGGQAATSVRMHDGSVVNFRPVGEDYDPRNRIDALSRYNRLTADGEVPTGLLFVDEETQNFHQHNGTVAQPLWDYPYDELCPGAAALEKLMQEFR